MWQQVLMALAQTLLPIAVKIVAKAGIMALDERFPQLGKLLEECLRVLGDNKATPSTALTHATVSYHHQLQLERPPCN